jgi:hypothetical protein
MEPEGILVLHHQFLSISRWLFRCLTQMIIPSLPLYTHHVQQSNYAGGKLNSWLQLAPRFLSHWAPTAESPGCRKNLELWCRDAHTQSKFTCVLCTT